MKNADLEKRNIAFVLPGEARSGGVRVTMLMANELLRRGCPVRIICLKPPKTLLNGVKQVLRSRFGLRRNTGWLSEFNGQIDRTSDLVSAMTIPGEIIIAVGTYVAPKVKKLDADIIKVRYNHGMPSVRSEENLNAWRGSMPTITVSNTLVPKLEELSGESVCAVIPNGIDTDQYFPDRSVSRDGIGAVFNPHPNKDPELMIEMLKEAHRVMPDVPQYVFSTEERPNGLEHTIFKRYPSVDEARQIYSRAKVWLMTSRTEGLPGVALEAMACGCVMVTSNNDGSLEIVTDNINGLVVEQSDRGAYIDAIKKILQNEGERERLSQGALATASQYTWEKAADKMVAFLSTLKKARSKSA